MKEESKKMRNSMKVEEKIYIVKDMKVVA